MAESRQNTLTYMKYWQDEIKVPDLQAAAIVIFDSVHNVADTVTLEEFPHELSLFYYQ